MSRKSIQIIVLIIFCWLLLLNKGSANDQQKSFEQKQSVNLYAYHLKPPFIVDKNNKIGLYYDFADYLNKNSQHYLFETIFIPRKRIEKMLEDDNFDGLLLGVSPVWFKDKEEKKYLWTSSFYRDRDEVISSVTQPIEYSQPQSLTGHIFGGVRGFYYFGINELVATGKIKRQDTIGEAELLDMVRYKRVDAAIISRSTFDFLTVSQFDRQAFHLSEKPHDEFERRILVPHQYVTIYQHINDILNDISTDPDWHNILEQYN
ncbi:substrate-binding periplasmic protein [Thalassotalea sp. PLHSN55]|uniref:substrate-binding periplasmic protein n=1 Tax=Thalassotalea sp. PLHSN55 TaxID=3435888 RepID=UPI003F865C60